MDQFANKVAVVTGAASGIGRALANAFAAEGMRVVMADIEPAALAASAQQLRESGAPVLAVVTDVGRWASMLELAKKTVDTFGEVHILCNNAGVSGAVAPVWTQTIDDWKWTLGVNLWGVIHGIKAFLPHMSEGHIVNTASIMGLLASPMCAPYIASKAAVAAISEGLAYELHMLKRPIGVSVLCPAGVATNIIDSDRNRPAELAGTHASPAEANKWKEVVREAIDKGMRPEAIAAEVVAAIKENRFYILPHKSTKKAVEARFQAILSGAQPPPPKFD